MTKKKAKAEEMAQVAIPATQNIEEALVKNQLVSQDCQAAGSALWRRIEQNGVDEIAADEVRAYLFRAASEVQQIDGSQEAVHRPLTCCVCTVSVARECDRPEEGRVARLPLPARAGGLFEIETRGSGNDAQTTGREPGALAETRREPQGLE